NGRSVPARRSDRERDHARARLRPHPFQVLPGRSRRRGQSPEGARRPVRAVPVLPDGGHFRRNRSRMAGTPFGLVCRRKLDHAERRRHDAGRSAGQSRGKPGSLTIARRASPSGTRRSAYWPLTTFDGIDRAMSEGLKWIGGTSVVAAVLLASAVVAGNALDAQEAAPLPVMELAPEPIATPAPALSPEPFVIKTILPIDGAIRYGEWHWDDSRAPTSGPLVMTV